MLNKLRKRVPNTRRALFQRGWATTGSKLHRSHRLAFEPLEPRLVLDTGPLYITELMAVNDTVWADGDGEFPDWIEIHNPTGTAVEMEGWYLTDKQDNLTKWEFPAYTLAPGEHLVVFASEKDPDGPPGELHTNFKLKGDGEYLGLIRPQGTANRPPGPFWPIHNVR